MALPFRLICALLALLVTLPALQTNACAPLPTMGGGASHEMAHHGHDLGNAPRHAYASADHPVEHKPALPMKGKHECVGCVPPINTRVFRAVTALEFHRPQSFWLSTSASLNDWLGAPVPPPPRHLV